MHYQAGQYLFAYKMQLHSIKKTMKTKPTGYLTTS